MAAEDTGLLHEQVANGIRRKIISGEYAVGDPIPSTTELRKQYGASQTAVRQAVSQLKATGVLIGRPGKGVYVKASPDEAAAWQADLKALSEQVTELARRVEGYDDLREIVGSIQANLVDLYGKTGHTYPEDETPARRRRSDRTVRHG